MKPVPLEKWPEWRAEQSRKDHNKGVLVSWLERCMDDGITVFSKKTILDFVKGDFETACFWINRWESEGILEVLKPLSEASGPDNVIKMKKFIARASDSYPGNWPFDERTNSN